MGVRGGFLKWFRAISRWVDEVWLAWWYEKDVGEVAGVFIWNIVLLTG